MKEIQASLIQLAHEGDEYHGSWWNETKFKRVIAFMQNFMDPNHSAHVLDVGCGAMTLSNALRCLPNLRVHGVDVVFEVLRGVARQRAPDIPVVTGDIEDLPFGDETFDIVVHNQVLHHFRQYGQVLKEIRRVLRRSGILISVETNGWNPYVYYEHKWGRLRRLGFISDNERPFSYLAFRRNLNRSGLQVLGFRMINFDFIPCLTPFDRVFGKIPLFNLVFGGSMLVCSQKVE